MRIADRIVLDGAQAETLRGVVGRLLQPAVVETERLGLAIFEEQLAIVSSLQAPASARGERHRGPDWRGRSGR